MQVWRKFLRAHAQIVYKEILSRSKFDVPSLLAIPAFGRIVWLYIRHLNSNREYAYANDLEIMFNVMNVLAKE